MKRTSFLGVSSGKSCRSSCMHACMLSHFSHVQLCATPGTAAHQAPLSTGFSRQEYWSGLPFPSSSISPSNKYSGLISLKIDCFDLAVQGTLMSLLQPHSSKASILQHSAFFMVQLSHTYMTTGKTIALARRTIVGKVMSLLFNMLSWFVASGGQSIGASAWASALPVNIQGWFPLGLTDLISLQSKDSQEFSPTP